MSSNNGTAASAISHRYSISEAAVLLDRSPHTLRSWDRNEVMPVELRPSRDANGNRYWTKELIEQIKGWIAESGFHPGRGIDYHPDAQRLQQHIERIRHSSRRGTDDSTELLKALIEDALDTLGLTQEGIVAMIPQVISQYDISLQDALRVAADVFAQRA